MLFILGLIIGGCVGFFVCAICSVARANNGEQEQNGQKTGEQGKSNE